jgi:hypothetical protein
MWQSSNILCGNDGNKSELHSRGNQKQTKFLECQLLSSLLLSKNVNIKISKTLILPVAFVGKPEVKGPLERPRHRWENNIKMYLREIGFGDVDWVHMAQDRDRWRPLVNRVMNVCFLQNAANFLTS